MKGLRSIVIACLNRPVAFLIATVIADEGAYHLNNTCIAILCFNLLGEPTKEWLASIIFPYPQSFDFFNNITRQTLKRIHRRTRLIRTTAVDKEGEKVADERRNQGVEKQGVMEEDDGKR